MPDVVVTGNLTAADGTGGTAPPAGSVIDIGAEDRPAISVDLEGTFTGTAVIEATTEMGPAAPDWFTPIVLNAALAAASATLTAPGRRLINAAGLARVRLRCTALSSGTPAVTLRAGQGFIAAAGGGGGGAVTIADGADVAEGARADAAASDDTSAASVVALFKRLLQRITVLIAQLPGSLVAGRLDVNIGGSGVTQAISGTVIANAGTGPFPAAGDVASGATDSGNPVKLGLVAVAHGADPTAATAGQRINLYANRHGMQFHIGGHPNVKTVRANYTAAQTDTALVTIATGSKIVCTSFMITAHNANTVNVAAVIGFGTANTPTTTGVLGAHPGIAPGSGFGRGGGAGILGGGADDEDLRVTLGVPTAGSMDVVASYYLVPS